MVISYKVYEMSLLEISLISFEMTTSVWFCLSYDSRAPDKREYLMIISALPVHQRGL